MQISIVIQLRRTLQSKSNKNTSDKQRSPFFSALP